MHTRHTASAFAIAAIAALTLAACGGDDGSPPGSNPGSNPGHGASPAPQASAQLKDLDLDVQEEMLKPGETATLEVDVEDVYDRDVPNANVQLSFVKNEAGATLGAAQLRTNWEGEAQTTIKFGNKGAVVVKATSGDLSTLLGMVVKPLGVGEEGLHWELPAVVEIGPGDIVRLDDADDGLGGRSYSVNSADFTLNQCGDDVCLKAPAGMRAGTYDLTFTVTDTASSTLDIPVQVVVR